MSAFFEIFIIIPEGMVAEAAIMNTHTVLTEHGSTIDDDSLLILHETEREEPEPRDVVDPITDLKLIANWPTYGYMRYFSPVMPFGVSFTGVAYERIINCIEIGLHDGIYNESRPRSEGFFYSLAKRLHIELNAKRTLMGWDLTHQSGFHSEDEIERLKKGQIEGHYEMLDIIRAD